MDNQDTISEEWLKDAWAYYMSNNLIPLWMTLEKFKKEWKMLDLDVERFKKEES